MIVALKIVLVIVLALATVVAIFVGLLAYFSRGWTRPKEIKTAKIWWLCVGLGWPAWIVLAIAL